MFGRVGGWGGRICLTVESADRWQVMAHSLFMMGRMLCSLTGMAALNTQMVDPPPWMTPASPALVRSNTTTTGGQRDGRKQEVEAEDHVGACVGVGGGNLTFTFLTNPPVNKDLLPCSAGLCCDPPRPPQKTCCLQFPHSCCKGENGHGGFGRPRGDREDAKLLGFFRLKETREGSK